MYFDGGAVRKGDGAMRDLDGMRIIGLADGEFSEGATSKRRELIAASETGSRWSLGEVTAEPDESVATHVHPGEAEAFIIVEGEVELHGAEGVAQLAPGDVVFIPPDTEHGLRTPNGGRWFAVWPVGERLPGKRYVG
jgi:quercetin dioxygenase-like cupin family protein